MNIQVVFVDNTGLISDIIKDVEKLGDKTHSTFVPSHCGIIVDNVFREALANGFVQTDVHRYDRSKLRVFNVPVSNIDAVRAKFQELAGRKYGYRALVNGILYTMCRLETNGDGETTGDCSEDDTRILRVAYPDFLGSIPADDVTPLVLYEGIGTIGTETQDY